MSLIDNILGSTGTRSSRSGSTEEVTTTRPVANSTSRSGSYVSTVATQTQTSTYTYDPVKSGYVEQTRVINETEPSITYSGSGGGSGGNQIVLPTTTPNENSNIWLWLLLPLGVLALKKMLNKKNK